MPSLQDKNSWSQQSDFKYSAGPWNIHPGADPFGPPVRAEREMAAKLQLLKSLGFDYVQFHDDDAVTSREGPHMKPTKLESPPPFTANGAKGMGEGGGAPLHAICSALQDAIGTDGPIVSNSHNHWERIFRLMHPEPGERRGVAVASRAGGETS